jgi:hypothetical protein
MAIGMIFSPPKDIFTDETYAKVLEHLGDGFPPSTMSLHVKGKTADGEVRIIDVFDSQEAFEAFASSHAPVYEKLGLTVDDIMKHATFFEVERTIK